MSRVAEVRSTRVWGIATAATEFIPTGLPVIQNGGAPIVFGAVFSTLTPGKRYVVAVEPGVTDGAMNLLRG